MAEGTYEYECMRAELLGIDKPNLDEFTKRKLEEEANKVEEEQIENEELQNAELQGEELKNTGGKLEELNSILAKTQKKIDNFKFRCGSVTDMIKTKIGSISGGAGGENGATTTAEVADSTDGGATATSLPTQDDGETTVDEVNGGATAVKKSQLSRALDRHVDKLDSMLENTEKAQISMNEQNKQMKKFLK